MMTKEELQKLYAEYKQGDCEIFTYILSDNLKRVLKDIGFDISLESCSILYGKRRRKLLYNYVTITIKRGNEQYITQRVNALIDFIFAENRDEKDLFDIIYNRV